MAAAGGDKKQMVGLAMAMVLMATAVLSAGVAAQSNCTTVLLSLSPCLNFITGSSSTPTGSCCSQLASVVASQPRCLCTVLDGSAAASLGITINQTRALALPSACNVQTPPVSKCNEVSDAPAGGPARSPMGAIGPSGGGVSSDASLAAFTPLMFFYVLIISYAATVASF